MAITSFNTLIEAQTTEFRASETFYAQAAASGLSLISAQSQSRLLFPGRLRALPAVPGGKSFFVPTAVEIASTVGRQVIVCELTSFGSIDISGASGTFTDGSVAPTVTEGGVSRQISSSVLAVVTTALNATPGTLTITYVDQDGNTAETTGSMSLTASAVVNTAAVLPLNANDWGARDVTAAARSGGTSPSGVIEFFHCQPICTVSASAGRATSANLLTDYALLPKLAANSALAFLATANTAGAVQGVVHFVAL